LSIAAICIETERLILRPPIAADFDAYAANAADAESMRFIGGAQSQARAWRTFLTAAGAWLVQGFSTFSVIEKASGRWIGRVGPWHPVDWPGGEIGWSLIRDAWGNGFAYEAAVAATDWAFEHLGWHEVLHLIDPANHASQAVARRLGSHLRGTMNVLSATPDDLTEVWGQTREQWQQRGAGPRN
jgi:RimJ/RimL family protein N-acetyltransferase